LFYVSASQINAQVPWGGTGGVYPEIMSGVEPGYVACSYSTIGVSSVPAPAIFTTNQSGSGQGAILISGTSGTLAGPSAPGARPVMAGEFLEIYATGLGSSFVDSTGKTVSPPTVGTPSPSPPLSTATNPTVTIGGVPATVSFAGLAPGFVALFQINVLVPANAPSGSTVPLILTIGGVASNTVTIAVQ
jgi:uncharacterized protein (TIGR03437 family)